MRRISQNRSSTSLPTHHRPTRPTEHRQGRRTGGAGGKTAQPCITEASFTCRVSRLRQGSMHHFLPRSPVPPYPGRERCGVSAGRTIHQKPGMCIPALPRKAYHIAGENAIAQRSGNRPPVPAPICRTGSAGEITARADMTGAALHETPVYRRHPDMQGRLHDSGEGHA